MGRRMDNPEGLVRAEKDTAEGAEGGADPRDRREVDSVCRGVVHTDGLGSNGRARLSGGRGGERSYFELSTVATAEASVSGAFDAASYIRRNAREASVEEERRELAQAAGIA